MTSPARPAGAREPLVLVVEDEPQLMRFLRATLPVHGYQVDGGDDGQQALIEASTPQGPTSSCSTSASPTSTGSK